MNAAVLVLACLAGAGAMAVGLRGRRVGGALSCAACGYEAGEAPPERCSECGARLRRPGALVRGKRRPRRLLVALGGFVLALGLMATALEVRGGLSGAVATRLKPAAWLLREIGPVATGVSWPRRIDSLDEFEKRLREGRVASRNAGKFLDLLLPADPRVEPSAPSRWVRSIAAAAATRGMGEAHRVRAVGWILARQADASASWDGDWGAAIERLRMEGLLSDDYWARYQAALAAPILRLQSGPQAQGDTVPVMLAMGWRGGRASGLTARIEVELDGEAAVVLVTRLSFVEVPQSPSILWDRLASGSWGEPVAMLTLPDRPGKFSLTGIVRVGIKEGAAGAEGDSRTAPNPVLRTHQVALVYEVGDFAFPETNIVHDPTLRSRVEASLRSVGPLTAAGGPSGIVVRGSLEFVQPPMDLAFDVIWREGADAEEGRAGETRGSRLPPREWRVGWLLFERDHGAFAEPYQAVLHGFDAPAVDIVLRPSLGLLRRHSRIREIWGGEIVLPNRTVTWTEPR